MNRARSIQTALACMALLFFTPSAGAAAPDGDPPAQGEIKVVARRYKFEPKTITVRKGQKVRLAVTSVDVDHGLAISEFNVDVSVPAKQTKIVEFTPNREGKFRITCSVFCGEGHPDMEGELVVTGAQSASSSSNIQVKFEEGAAGVVIVESNGERIRIDTNAKTVTPLDPAEAGKVATSGVTPDEPERRQASEPYDYRLVNVPTPKRVPRGSLNVHFTHRFTTPINEDDRSFKDQAEELFGLDSFSVSSFGLSYGITDRLYASAYRSPICQSGICKTIEIGLGYHLLDEAGRSPVALSAYTSVEGEDNFSESYTFNIQAMVARSVTKYVNLFFSPAVHINSNGNGRFNPRPEDFFPPAQVANDFELGQHTGSFGFGVNARIRPSTSLIFEYTPRVGFKLGRVDAVFTPDFTQVVGFRNVSEASIGFGIEKRIGRHSFALTFSNSQTTTTSRYNSSNLALPADKFIIGFNLFRRLL